MIDSELQENKQSIINPKKTITTESFSFISELIRQSINFLSKGAAMKKYTYIMSVLCFFIISSQSLGQYQLQWEHIYSRTENSMDESVKIGADNQGNYYVAGMSFAPGIGSGNIVIKYNNSGDTLWTRIYPGNIQIGGDFIVKDNGDFYLTSGAGSQTLTFKCNSDGNVLWSSSSAFQSPKSMVVDDDGNTYVLAGSFNAGIILIKYNFNGSEEWVRNYVDPDPSEQPVVKVIIDNDGNIVVGGNTRSNQAGFLVLKYNPQGDLLWNKIYSRSIAVDYLNSITVDNSNNIIAGGYTERYPSFDYDITVVKFNPAGEQQWAKHYNSPSNTNDILVDIITDNEDNIYAGGNIFEGSSTAAVILKYSPTGDSLNAFFLTGETENHEQSAFSHSVSGAKFFRFLGNISLGLALIFLVQNEIVYMGFNYALLATFALAYEINGFFLTSIYGIIGPNVIVLDSKNDPFPDFIVTAHGMDTLLFRSDIITAKFSDKTTSVSDDLINPGDFILHQNYPNPFNPSTTISWQSPIGSWQTLKVYDVLGREVAVLVDEYKDAGSNKVEFNAGSLSSGVYLYKLQAGDFYSTKKLLLIK